MSDTPESSRQRFEDWCKESGHWYLAEDRQAFSAWSARDKEVAAKDARIAELETRIKEFVDYVSVIEDDEFTNEQEAEYLRRIQVLGDVLVEEALR